MKETIREQLVVAAEDLFRRVGFPGPTLEEIARAADVDADAARWEVGSVEELAHAVMERGHDRWLARRGFDAFGTTGVDTGIPAIVDAFRDLVATEALSMRIFFVLRGQALAGNREVAARLLRFHDGLLHITTSWTRRQAEQVGYEGDAEALGSVLAAALAGLPLMLLEARDPARLERAFDGLAAVLRHGLARAGLGDAPDERR